MIHAGIDAGSRTIKAVLVDDAGMTVLDSGIVDQGVQQALLASRLFDDVLEKAGLRRKDIGNVIATGYGRSAIDFADTTVTEITCHACGVRRLSPKTRTVIDIGGQDSKLIRLDADGRVRDFVMNDRCAAGTGRFLELVAARLELSPDQIGDAALAADKPAAISSMCAVFAESEIIGLLAAGEKPANIVAGVQAAIASRIGSMAGRNIEEPVLFTGGVALVPKMDEALAGTLDRQVFVAENPQMTGALGAALLAAKRS